MSPLHPSLHPSALFDLSQYQHHDLFAGCEYAWEPLDKLKGYLASVVGNIANMLVPNGVHLVDAESIFIGEGSVLEPGCWIQGPCILGQGCTVRQGAYIRGYFLAGDHCVIGHTTEVKHAIFLDGVHAAHFAYVGDTILGNRVNLGAGVKCANLKFDGSTVTIPWQGQRLNTGRRKLGAIVGDDVQIGCNAVTNPGTVIGPRVFWYPCINRGGVIPPNTHIKSNVN